MKQTEQALTFDPSIKTIFTGYESLYEKSKITALVCDNQLVDFVEAGQACALVVEKTPFYVACGGQVDDQGTISFGSHQTILTGLQKVDDVVLISCIAPTKISVGDLVAMQVNEYARLHTMKNHTATHLLQAALQSILGKQVKQAGSVVTADYLRFDYTYHQPMSSENIKQVEDLVNQKIWDNIPVGIDHTTLKDAVHRGIIAFFGDKYNPDAVRAVVIPGFSAELCGGTHVRATGDIGLFKIVEDSALAAGQRRIVAYTGGKALELMQSDYMLVKKLEQDLKVKADHVTDAVEKLQSKIKDLTQQVKLFKSEQWKSLTPVWLEQSYDVQGMPCSYLVISGFADNLRDIVHAMQTKKPGFYFVMNEDDGKALFIGSIAKEFTDTFSMKDFQAWLQEHCGLRSGGNALQIQGGGNIPGLHCKDQMKKWLQAR